MWNNVDETFVSYNNFHGLHISVFMFDVKENLRISFLISIRKSGGILGIARTGTSIFLTSAQVTLI